MMMRLQMITVQACPELGRAGHSSATTVENLDAQRVLFSKNPPIKLLVRPDCYYEAYGKSRQGHIMDKTGKSAA